MPFFLQQYVYQLYMTNKSQKDSNLCSKSVLSLKRDLVDDMLLFHILLMANETWTSRVEQLWQLLFYVSAKILE